MYQHDVARVLALLLGLRFRVEGVSQHVLPLSKLSAALLYYCQCEEHATREGTCAGMGALMSSNSARHRNALRAIQNDSCLSWLLAWVGTAEELTLDSALPAAGHRERERLALYRRSSEL
jgi:hypothetical protein